MLDKEKLQNWEKILPLIEISLRSATSSSRPFSPYFLFHGYEMRTPFYLTYPPPEESNHGKATLTESEYDKGLKERLKLVYEMHRQNLQADSVKMKEAYDKKVRSHNYSVGDIVWLRDESSQGLPRRLQKRFIRPFQLDRFITDNYTVILRNLTTGNFVKGKVHVDRLKLYESDLTEEQKRNLEKENIETSEVVPTKNQLAQGPAEQSNASTSSSFVTDAGVDVRVEQSGIVKNKQSFKNCDRAMVRQNKRFIPKLTLRQTRYGQPKEILKERFLNGHRQFLISRFHNTETGERFNPIWVNEAQCPFHLRQGYEMIHRPVFNGETHRYNLRNRNMAGLFWF